MSYEMALIVIFKTFLICVRTITVKYLINCIFLTFRIRNWLTKELYLHFFDDKFYIVSERVKYEVGLH